MAYAAKAATPADPYSCGSITVHSKLHGETQVSAYGLEAKPLAGPLADASELGLGGGQGHCALGLRPGLDDVVTQLGHTAGRRPPGAETARNIGV